MVVVIFGVKVKADEPLYKSLSKVYGIGVNQSQAICSLFGLSKSFSYSGLNIKKRKKLRKILRKMLFGTQLLQKKRSQIEMLKDINTYRGFRHKKKLPVRGQRTRSNARTRRNGI